MGRKGGGTLKGINMSASKVIFILGEEIVLLKRSGNRRS